MARFPFFFVICIAHSGATNALLLDDSCVALKQIDPCLRQLVTGMRLLWGGGATLEQDSSALISFSDVVANMANAIMATFHRSVNFRSIHSLPQDKRLFQLVPPSKRRRPDLNVKEAEAPTESQWTQTSLAQLLQRRAKTAQTTRSRAEGGVSFLPLCPAVNRLAH